MRPSYSAVHAPLHPARLKWVILAIALFFLITAITLFINQGIARPTTPSRDLVTRTDLAGAVGKHRENRISDSAKTTWTGRVEQAQRFHQFHRPPVQVVFEPFLSVSLRGEVPIRYFPSIQQKSNDIWSYLIGKLQLDAGVPPPEVYFHAFDRRTQPVEWTAWQKAWTGSHLEIWRDWTRLVNKGEPTAISQDWVDRNIDRVYPFPKSFLAFHYDGTNRIQMNPARTFEISVQTDPYGVRRDLSGQGYYSMGHEMIHYALESKGVLPTRLHHCIFIHVADGDEGPSLMEDMADFLVKRGMIAASVRHMGLRGERSFDPCGALDQSEIARVETFISELTRPSNQTASTWPPSSTVLREARRRGRREQGRRGDSTKD